MCIFYRTYCRSIEQLEENSGNENMRWNKNHRTEIQGFLILRFMQQTAMLKNIPHQVMKKINHQNIMHMLQNLSHCRNFHFYNSKKRVPIKQKCTYRFRVHVWAFPIQQDLCEGVLAFMEGRYFLWGKHMDENDKIAYKNYTWKIQTSPIITPGTLMTSAAADVINHNGRKIDRFKPIRFCNARMMSAQSWSRHHWFEPTSSLPIIFPVQLKEC